MIQSGFAFVASHFKIIGDLPLTLIPEHVFRRARNDEIVLIQQQLQSPRRAGFGGWVHYDSTILEEKSGGGTSYRIEKLPEEQWKYWVVSTEFPNQTQFHEIELMGLLLPVELEFAFHLYFEEPDQRGEVNAIQYMPTHVIDKYTSHDLAFKNATELTVKQLMVIGELLPLYSNISAEFSFVTNALKNFSDLRRVPMQSNLYVVGLFSIIESLITHAPRLTETLDSINHQISNKIILLRKQYDRSVLPTQYFLDATEESIWKKLYGYRSSIAHGSLANFNSEFQVLRDHNTVIKFLSDNVKELIILALKNSQFMSDLRRC